MGINQDYEVDVHTLPSSYERVGFEQLSVRVQHILNLRLILNANTNQNENYTVVLSELPKPNKLTTSRML